MQEKKRPSVGLGIIIVKDEKVLMHRRKGTLGKNTWSFLGGHLEWNESVEDCAKRETLEESGLKIRNVRFLCVTNDIFSSEDRHYITIFVAADYVSGNLRLNDEESHELGWFDLNKLPQPIFEPVRNLMNGNCMPKNWKSNL